MAGTNTPERAAVAAAYNGPRWAKKVQAMSDAQVIAIYFRLKNQGVIK